MDAQVIQLSDRQQSEPRIEAIAYMDETEKAAQAIRVLNARGDVLGVQRVALRLLEMVEVGREEIDRLTLGFPGFSPTDNGEGDAA
jgi:hypothetical protein